MVSNADKFTCVAQYNTNMQGVDRLDQLRGQFSLADGHTFKKWYKKLGMAIVDVARVNAYMSRTLSIDLEKDRDPHRSFVAQLTEELISGN
ncbi:Transposase [Phytophthora palmivora]|uniref:Transposase n=1 Tax=Phytophthora palmivora TaxID=4796 RepID=A0A2P4XQ39_9STRA|nr:Transposase [Phytophthora palmivora]